MQAAEVGNLPAVIYLVGSGADVNVKNDFGGTALYHARNHSRAPDSNEADKIAEYPISKGATE